MRSKSRVSCTLVTLLLALPLQEQAPVTITEVHMGVPVRLVLYASDERVARAAARAAYARVADLEDKMSDYRAESEVRRLQLRAREWVVVSPELFEVLSRAVQIARLSDGAFDPTVGPFVALWRESRRDRQLPTRVTLDSARQRVGWRKVSLDSVRRAVRLESEGMQIDLGAIAKGYMLQAALDVLRARGARRALLEAGGDIVVGDAPPGRSGWHIEVPHAGSKMVRASSALTNAAISTSGPSEQFVEIAGVRYSHVVDPQTGYGLTNPYEATVIAPEGAVADALSTALSVLGPGKGAELLKKVGKNVLGDIRRIPGWNRQAR